MHRLAPQSRTITDSYHPILMIILAGIAGLLIY